jgi:hypothetical protein
MQTDSTVKTHIPPRESLKREKTSKAALWAGRTISGLLALFLLFDAFTKILKAPAVIAAAAQLGFSESQIFGIGILLLLCTIVYVIPRTSILGAILLTGYLGGATVTQLHSTQPFFTTFFPPMFGALVWAGIFLRDRAVRSLIPLRQPE